MLYSIAKNACKLFYRIIYKIEVLGEENIPSNGGAIICPNHKSNHDAVLITASLKRKLSFLGKEELFKFPPFGFLLKAVGVIPIKRGSGDIGAVKKSIEILKDGKILTVFPEGTRNKTNDIKLLEFKSGASLIAYKAGVPIVPCAIVGSYKPFSKIKIIFGTPIDMNFPEKPDLHQVTDDLKNSVEKLLEGKI